MSLTISDLVFDEGGLIDLDNDADNNVASLSFLTAGQSAVIAALPKASFPAFFPQYAQLDDFVSSTQQVNNYSLTTDGTHTFTTTSAIATNLYVGGNEVFLYGTSDPTVVVGRIGTGHVANASGNVALVLVLDQTKVGGFVTDASLSVAVYAPFDHSVAGAFNTGTGLDDDNTLDLTGLVQLRSEFTVSTEVDFDSFAGVPSGSDAFAMILPDGSDKSVQLLATGFTGSAEGRIWISQDANAGSIGGGGASGQHVAPGNSLRIDTITGGDFSKADTPSEDNDPGNITYQHHKAIFQASFTLVQVNPGTSGQTTSLDISAYNAITENAQGSSYVTDALANEGTTVAINKSDVHIFNGANDITDTFGGSITQHGSSVTITGLQFGYTVKFSTPGLTFDRFVVTNDQPTKGSGSNVTFDVGHIHVSTVSNTPGTEFADLGQHTIFEDAGPSISTSGTPPTLTVDETNLGTDDHASFAALFTPHYGPDGAGSTGNYTLGVKAAGVNSGLVDTLTGHNIFLYVDGSGNVVGKVGSSTTVANSNGAVAFTISVNSATGDVNLDQARAIVHSDPNAVNESTGMTDASLVTLTATATDSDGDGATAIPVGIATAFSFLDDEPSMDDSTDANKPNDLQVANVTSGALSSADSFYVLHPGNDGQKGYTIVNPDTGDYTPDHTGTFQWNYANAAHTAINGYFVDAQNVQHSFYTLALTPATGAYTFTMTGLLPNKTESLTSTIIHAGGPVNQVDVAAANSTDFGRIIGADGTNNPLINASHGFVGVDNGNLDGGESINLSLHHSDGSVIDFSGLTIGTKSAGLSHYNYILHMSDNSTVEIDNVAVPKGQVITVSDPNPNDNVLIDNITVFKVDGQALKIGLAGITFSLPPDDIKLGFEVQLQDGDNDVATKSFTVSIDGNNDGHYDATAISAAAPLGSATLSSAAGPSSELLHHELLAADHLIALN